MLRSLQGIQQFTALQSLNIALNCIADPRQLLFLPPPITSRQMQGNPCPLCLCAHMAVLAACPLIKTIDSIQVPHWHATAAASAVELQASMSQFLVGVALLYRAVAAAKIMAVVNVEFVTLFGQQNYNYHHHQQQQQHLAIAFPGISAARSIFSSLIDAAQALCDGDDDSRCASTGSSSSSSRSFAAIKALSSLPSLSFLVESGTDKAQNH